MWLKQQVKLVLLLFLFSVGICVPAFCLANEQESQQVTFGEIEEDESKEELEKTELLAALSGANVLTHFSFNSMYSLSGKMVLRPKQISSRTDSSRAPPAYCR